MRCIKPMRTSVLVKTLFDIRLCGETCGGGRCTAVLSGDSPVQSSCYIAGQLDPHPCSDYLGCILKATTSTLLCCHHLDFVCLSLSVWTTALQVSILQQPAFCVVRSLVAFRLTSTHKDYCVVGTDAGKITILEYLPETSEVRYCTPNHDKF